MDLTVLPRRLNLRNEHGFLRQPVAARLGNQVPGSEPLANPSSTGRCKTRQRPLLPSCGAASICDSRRSKARVSHTIRVWNKPFSENRATCEPPRSMCRCDGTNYTRESLIESDELPKEIVGIRVFLTRSLFACGTLRGLLLRVPLAKATSAPLRF